MIKKTIINIIPLLLTVVVVCSYICFNGGKMNNDKGKLFSSLREVPESKWKDLSRKTIYFGHMSVGYNILKGVEDIIKEYPAIKLDIMETPDLSECQPAVFYHSQVGENTKPKMKVADFEKKLKETNCDIDIALLKFCYVDFNPQTDVNEIIEYYNDAIDRIRQKKKDIKIIHVTAPFTVNQKGLKAVIKRILGRPAYGEEENIKRFEYNEQLKVKFFGKEPIFDLATIESTMADGSRASFNWDGKVYFQLNEDYTYDGGHLNEIGRKVAAEKFLLSLVNQI